MSYALAFAPDAYSQGRALDPELQEGVLDQADRLAGEPPRAPAEEVLRDFVLPAAGLAP